MIIHAGDPDREGQLLVDEVLEYVNNNKPVKRILINALDEKSIREALADLRSNSDFIGLRKSALARARADWLIGMNMSRAYTAMLVRAGYGRLDIGRVLTPTMAIVVRREEEIKNFVQTNYYQAQVTWQHKNGKLLTIWKPKEEAAFLDNEGRIMNKEICDVILNKLKEKQAVGNVVKIERKKKQEGQKLPYSLSMLQIEAGKKYGYSPKKVLDIMQELYEKKLTTYPRSDCEYLPENQIGDAEIILGNLKTIFQELVDDANLSIRSRAWNDKKISAHHAIIPTRMKCDLQALTDEQQRLYMLVAKAFLAQFYPVHSYIATKIMIECENESFLGSGRQITEIGWKIIYEDSEDKTEPTLPNITEGDKVAFFDAETLIKQTQPPTRFNPSTLLQAMKEIYKYVNDESLKNELKECKGIGTEATRAGIIEKLQSAGFFTLSKKSFVPTDIAKVAVKILSQELTYPDMTAIWEKAFEDIEAGKLDLDAFYFEQVSNVKNMIENVKTLKISVAKNAVVCPTCKSAMIRRPGKNGKSFFWGCSNYPVCKMVAFDKDGKPDFTERKAYPCPHVIKGCFRKEGSMVFFGYVRINNVI